MRFLIIVIVALLTACGTTVDEQLTVRKTNPALWLSSDPVIFELPADNKMVDMELVVRFDPAKNVGATLPLVVTTTLTNRKYTRDTVIVMLRDDNDKPQGRKQGAALDLTIPYRRNSTIQTPGTVMKIAPANPTVGIYFVTLKTTPAQRS